MKSSAGICYPKLFSFNPSIGFLVNTWIPRECPKVKLKSNNGYF